jgi:hypothetical protein
MRATKNATIIGFAIFFAFAGCKGKSADSSRGHAVSAAEAKRAQPAEYSTADNVEYVNNYALCELAVNQPKEPFGKQGKCENFNLDKRNIQQTKVDRGLTLQGHPSPLKLPELAKTYVIEIAKGDSGCFNFKDIPTAKSNPIKKEHLLQFFQQVEQIAGFLGEIHLSMHGDPLSTLLIPMRVEICSKAAGTEDLRLLEYRIDTRTMTLNFPYGQGKGMTPAPLKGQEAQLTVLEGYRVISKEEIWREWRSGTGALNINGKESASSEENLKQIKDSLASILQFKRDSIPEKLDSEFLIYWKLGDPLGLVQSALRSQVAGYRNNKLEAWLSGLVMISLLPSSESRVTAFLAQLSKFLPKSDMSTVPEDIRDYEALKLRVTDKNVERFIAVWQEKLFDGKIMDLALKLLSEQIYSCSQLADGKDKKKVDSFAAVEATRKIGICLKKQKPEGTAAIQSASDEIVFFADIETTGTAPFVLPADFLAELTRLLNSKIPWKVIHDTLQSATAP